MAAHRTQELAVHGKRVDGVGIEGDGVRQIGLGAVPVPVILHLHAAEHGPCLGQSLVEDARPLGRCARQRHRLIDRQRPQDHGRAQKQIGRREPGVSRGIVGIEDQRLLEQSQGLQCRQPRMELEAGPRLELQEISLRRSRAVAAQAGVVDGRQLRQ